MSTSQTQRKLEHEALLKAWHDFYKKPLVNLVNLCRSLGVTDEKIGEAMGDISKQAVADQFPRDKGENNS